MVKKQLDDPDNTLTPEEEDNCDIDSAPEVNEIEWETQLEDALRDSPVMKVYTKGPTTIQELESMGRLVRL